ncbi:MAG: hypothetical protein AVDCRST_MAG73-3942, partial [uncultured Thermomicrobiales bacterium]
MSVTIAEAPVAGAAVPPAKGGGGGGRRYTKAAYGYLAPVVISAIVFTIVPFFYTLYIAFTNYSLRNFAEYSLVG